MDHKLEAAQDKSIIVCKCGAAWLYGTHRLNYESMSCPLETAAQHGVQPDVAHAQQTGVNAEDNHCVESPRG